MHSLTSISSLFTLFLALLITSVSASPTAEASPQLGGVLNLLGQVLNAIPILATPPPAALFTKHPTPECANVNGGTTLCCESTFNGDLPLVVQAADAIAYKLNPNSINCIYGSRNVTTCNPGTRLCCQVDALASIPVVDNIVSLALYCQNAPSQN